MSDGLANIAVALGRSPELAVLAKATLVLVAVLIGVRSIRTARASVRHLVVVASFLALLLLPLASWLMTPVVIEVAAAADVAPEPTRPVGFANVDGSVSGGVPPPGLVGGSIPAPAGESFSLARLLRGAWAVGMLTFLVPIAGTLWRVRCIRRGAVPWAEGEALARQLGADAGLSRAVVVLRHEGVEAPMACGVVGPAIVLPWDVEAWSASDLRHALIHELEHVRRGDWPMHIIARVVCAGYWFHPLVWVAWRRLHLEAERACDDAVVRRSESRAYAVQLVQLAERLSASHPRPLLPMAGRSHLGTRIHAVLDGRVARGRAGRAWVVGAIAMAIVSSGVVAPVTVVAAGTRASQSNPPAGGDQSGEKPAIAFAGPLGIGIRAEPVPADAPRFEAASIRRDRSGRMPPPSQGTLVFVQGNRVTAPNITVRELIRNAYNYQHVPRGYVADGPAWIDEERYNLEAAAAAPFMPQQVRNVPPPDAAAMIRSLLADRFKLEVHNETRVERIHELVLERADGSLGPKLTPTQATCLGPFELVDLETTNRSIRQTPDGKPFFCPFMLAPGRPARLRTNNIRMQHLAMFLGLMPGINTGVVDRTGLTGGYDIDLEFTGDMILSPNAAPVPAEVVDTEVPTLPGALRQQLGLRLESVRALVEVLAIDFVERPSEN